MRNLIVVLGCLLFIGSWILAPAAAGEERASVATSTIRIGPHAFTLRTSVREAKLAGQDPGVLIHYTVRRAGVFMHPEDWSGGRFIGCTYGRAEVARFHAKPFPDEEHPIGWILRVGSICGNTHSGQYRIVVPKQRSSSNPSEWTYVEITFESKSDPISRRRRGLTEVWGTRQDWGGGGTATSIFIPYRIVIDEKGAVVSTALDSDPAVWPELDRGSHPPSMFLAGLDARDPALMRAALALWPDPKTMNAWCEGFGFPKGREALLELIAGIERVIGAKARLDQLTKGFR